LLFHGDVATRIDTKTRWSLLLVAVGAMGMAIATGAGACVKQPTGLLGSGGDGGSGGSGGSAGGGTGGTPVVENKGQELFDALDAELYDACGSCHDIGGIADTPFLAGPDHYQSITSWPDIVTKDPAQSKLVTYPVAGPQHPYAKLDKAPYADSLFPKVKEWLAEEAKGIVTTNEPDAGKIIDPFTPIMGFNAVYLDALGAEFTGMAVTFTALSLDETTLALSDIEVHPTATAGVHMVHPLFVVYPKGLEPDPDPVDSFSNVDQTFEPGQSGTLGPGTMIVTNFAPQAKLSMAFEKLELVAAEVDGGADGGTTTGGGCKDVAAFTANAQPLLQSNCVGCHGGANAQAKGAVDMSALTSDPTAACGQVKNRINPGDPPASQLFITTDPNGNAAHPYKFGGNDQNFNNFVTEVTKWIVAEQ
jgi:mono/diheme cytochrome c family protein